MLKGSTCITVTPLFTLFSVYGLLMMSLLYALGRSVARQHYCLAKQAFLLIEIYGTLLISLGPKFSST
jgi:hypothetical protein